MCVIFDLIAASILTNALRVWESVVLRIGKERAQLTDLCAALIQGSVYIRWQPSAALLTLSLVAMLLLCRVALFLLEVILLAIRNRIDVNPQSGTVRTDV